MKKEPQHCLVLTHFRLYIHVFIQGCQFDLNLCDKSLQFEKLLTAFLPNEIQLEQCLHRSHLNPFTSQLTVSY